MPSAIRLPRRKGQGEPPNRRRACGSGLTRLLYEKLPYASVLSNFRFSGNYEIWLPRVSAQDFPTPPFVATMIWLGHGRKMMISVEVPNTDFVPRG